MNYGDPNQRLLLTLAQEVDKALSKRPVWQMFAEQNSVNMCVMCQAAHADTINLHDIWHAPAMNYLRMHVSYAFSASACLRVSCVHPCARFTCPCSTY